MRKKRLVDFSTIEFWQGLCHISELTSNWLPKAEDVSSTIFTFPPHYIEAIRIYFFSCYNVKKLKFLLYFFLLQVFKVGDRVDVKLIEVRISYSLNHHRAQVPRHSSCICCNLFLSPHIKNNKNNKIQKIYYKKKRKTVPF